MIEIIGPRPATGSCRATLGALPLVETIGEFLPGFMTLLQKGQMRTLTHADER
jgi:hypothetical protein